MIFVENRSRGAGDLLRKANSAIAAGLMLEGAMKTSMTNERMSNMGITGMAGGMMGMPMMGRMPMMMPESSNMPGMMMPRCSIKMEKCAGGMKMTCTCDDKTAAMMMQNLCNMMAGGMVSCCMMMNGMCCCCCNMGMMGMCKMEMTEMGCMMTCTSGDKSCEKMIQACCDCINMMTMPGMTCCMMMNSMPVCCCVC